MAERHDWHVHHQEVEASLTLGFHADCDTNRYADTDGCDCVASEALFTGGPREHDMARGSKLHCAAIAISRSKFLLGRAEEQCVCLSGQLAEATNTPGRDFIFNQRERCRALTA